MRGKEVDSVRWCVVQMKLNGCVVDTQLIVQRNEHVQTAGWRETGGRASKLKCSSTHEAHARLVSAARLLGVLRGGGSSGAVEVGNGKSERGLRCRGSRSPFNKVENRDCKRH